MCLSSLTASVSFLNERLGLYYLKVQSLDNMEVSWALAQTC